ncbi:C2 calcium-dependent membrane targeting [Macleaya cordata]|uniref:C2 calcium-dependent membrane targeting n=1 Tax=Macleaya cordata TaxID=56857 RepID=A0A200RD33_MACCD|nr:C2 calcium-dependent membrane targeting [Macleaya cordata]
MRLCVYVLEARDLPVKDSEGLTDAFVKLHVGKYKSKTRVLKKTLNPVWNEEFVFRVHDIDDELIVSVFHHDDHGFFNAPGDLLGRVRIPLWSVIDEDNQTLPPTWFSLEKDKPHLNGKSMVKDSGKLLLTLSLHGGDNIRSSIPNCPAHSREYVGPAEPFHDILNSKVLSRKIPEGKHLVKVIAGRLEKLFNKNDEATKSDTRNEDSSDLSSTTSDYEDCVDEPLSNHTFEEAMELMQSRDDEHVMPEDLQGILLDQTYVVPPKDLNMLLFMPNSQFRRELADQQGATDLQEGGWTWTSGEASCLTRIVTYTKAASKLVKAVKATEEQTYLKADGRQFAVLVNVSTPDVPYGNCFKIELLYRIVPGPELSSGEESARLAISWNISFYQSTVMRSMIEGGARQGLKESFEQFADLLAQKFKLVNTTELLDKEHLLASLQTEHQSDWQLAIEYFWNFTVFSTIFLVLYVLLHILLSGWGKFPGLEFNGLDLPDTFGELITCGILVLQLERVFYMVSHFIQARLQRGSDHGVKSEGDGWMLTVALIEGSDISSVDSTSFSDPYVVFTCNGKTRTSSVKLQTRDPQWNEILEFDAMEEPPSVLDVEVFDFDGPFDQATSLGHAEINFLKHTSTELADIWVTLEGKLAQASQSKLHLRIFLDNNNGVETIKEYLTKMEKEVGKKLNLRSPYRNSAFQKLFGLPPEEFLISYFVCSLKRKMPLQGRLFLSARIVGFYANLFGHKTKFFFLWEDIDDVQVVPPSLASVGSPSLVIILRNGRGLDAKHGAKSQDEEGRLRFHFQSFVSFNVASRTITALWRTRTLSPELKVQMAEDQQDQDGRTIQIDDTGSFLGVEDDANMSKVYSAELPVNMTSLLQMFDGGNLEHKVMMKSGCVNCTTTPWEAVKPDVYERHICYKFNRHVSIFGGEVTSTQQKTSTDDGKGWNVDEVMTLHDVPFGDHFRVHLKYQIEVVHSASTACQCDVYLGIAWVKSTKFQQRITRNITDKFSHRLKEIFELVEREILLGTPHDIVVT